MEREEVEGGEKNIHKTLTLCNSFEESGFREENANLDCAQPEGHLLGTDKWAELFIVL